MKWQSPIFGLAVWVLLLSYSKVADIYELLFLFAPLVIVPLALVLIRNWLLTEWSPRLYRITEFLQPLCALAAVASFQTQTGMLAGTLACCWFLITCLCGVCGILLFLHQRQPSIPILCVIAGLVYLPVGGAWFVLSRFGIDPMGFQEPLILLTAVHFHYTGFAAPLLVALSGFFFTARSKTTRLLIPLAATATISGTPLLAIGFVISPLLKLFAAIILTFGLSMLALIQFLNLKNLSNAGMVLLATSGGSIVAGLSLALLYAWGEYRGQLLIGISEMAWTHGILNAFGFTLCGLLGWTLERK